MGEDELVRLDRELKENQEYLESLIKLQAETQKKEDIWWYAAIRVVAMLIALGGIFDILKRGLTIESILTLVIAGPLVYDWHQSDKHKERQRLQIDKLYRKEKSLAEERRRVIHVIFQNRKDNIRSSIMFVDWDGRPAVSLSPSEAYAILQHNGKWEKVDAADVFSTGKLVPSEEILRIRFEKLYGLIDVDPLISRLASEDRT